MTVINVLILLMISNKVHLKKRIFFMLLAHDLLMSTIYSVLVLLNLLLLFFSPPYTFIR